LYSRAARPGLELVAGGDSSGELRISSRRGVSEPLPRRLQTRSRLPLLELGRYLRTPRGSLDLRSVLIGHFSCWFSRSGSVVVLIDCSTISWFLGFIFGSSLWRIESSCFRLPADA
jgi:hypothetical protein